MDRDSDKIAAWMLCEDMLNKIKSELITQAIETLHKEIEAKSIAVKGSVVKLPERESGVDLDMFVINRLLEEADDMREMYDAYIKEKESKGSKIASDTVKRMEQLKKFLLGVDKISLLMHYSHSIDDWSHDVGMKVQVEEPSELLAKTTKGFETREEILDFVLKSKVIAREQILSKDEYAILGRTKEIINKPAP